MTLANKITIARLALIPVFIVFAVFYSRSIQQGMEDSRLRYLTLSIFALAALSDAADGYIARKYHQISKLGQALDPVADKLLLLAGVVTLSVTHWHTGLPLWFAVLVTARDLLIVGGVLALKHRHGKVAMRPLLSSKICTFLQLSCVCWVLVDFWSVESRPLPLDILIDLAALFTLISAVQYAREGIRQWQTTPE